MAKKVVIQGTYLKITDTINNVIEFEKSAKLSEFRKLSSTITALFFEDSFVKYYNIADLLDENNSPFADFYNWKDTNTGFKTASGGSGAIVVTANRTLISNSTGNVTASDVTNAELNAIDGDTLASGATIVDTDRIVLNDGGVMGQNSFTKVWEWITGKLNIGGASTILTTNLTANRALISNATGKVEVSTITTTQLQAITTLGTVIESVILTTLPTSVGTNLTSITLTPGKWLITGGVSLNQIDSEKASDYIALVISSTATAWAQVTIVQNRGVMARMVSGEDAGIACIPLSVTVTANTIYYLKAYSDFTTETNSLQAILTATKVGI